MVLLWYGGTGTSIGNLSYTWDANKNKTSETIGGTMSSYGFIAAGTSYDDEDRLTGYATCSMSVPPMVNNPTHELLTAGGQSLEADSKGMSKFLSSSLIPQASQLTPVARTGTGGSVVYVQHDQQTIADYPVGGVASTPTNRYVYASYIDEPVVRKAAGTSGTIHCYHRNQQYSITAMTTSTGAVAERYSYTAYGQPTILNASGTVLTSSAVGNRYTYTGREWDETLGLHHFRARWMSPLAGRFLGRDPIGYEGIEWSLYEIFKSHVFVMSDPLGLYPIQKGNRNKRTEVSESPEAPRLDDSCPLTDSGKTIEVTLHADCGGVEDCPYVERWFGCLGNLGTVPGSRRWYGQKSRTYKFTCKCYAHPWGSIKDEPCRWVQQNPIGDWSECVKSHHGWCWRK